MCPLDSVVNLDVELDNQGFDQLYVLLLFPDTMLSIRPFLTVSQSSRVQTFQIFTDEH